MQFSFERNATDYPARTVRNKRLSWTRVWRIHRCSQCAGMNRHEAEDESSSRERSSDPLGLESCAGYREIFGEA